MDAQTICEDVMGVFMELADKEDVSFDAARSASVSIGFNLYKWEWEHNHPGEDGSHLFAKYMEAVGAQGHSKSVKLKLK